ncbi:MAG: permease-like cell division protein FtsX [Clostridia bacterium]|nr:permease-like cell division protein FtsX [Clostridia bacterium]MBR6742846.1 permease-like cell division protein FtsX [Clostridia bacterium]
MRARKSYNPFYFIGQAFRGVFRNFSVTLGAVLVLVCCLVLMGSFYALLTNISENLNALSLVNKIVVFLDYDISDERFVEIEKEINGLKELGNLDVTPVSKEQGLENMKLEDPDYAHLYDSIPAEDNPLADSFIIEYDDASKVDKIVYNIRQIDGVRKVNADSELAKKVNSFKNGITVIFFFFFVVLLAVSVFVIINTVNMTVFSRKDEIYVMRFVGAGRWFISLPFVLEGIILGAFSGGVSYFIMKWLSGYVVESVVTGLDMLTVLPFEAYSSVILWGSLGIGVVCGVIGSTISIGRPLEA